MTIIEAYERSYAEKNKAIKQNLATKRTALNQEKQRVKAAGEEEMRLAYAKYMQAAEMKAQQARADGRSGSTEQNAVAGLGTAHRSAQDSRLFETDQKLAEIDSDIAQAEASAKSSIADNERALQLKKDQQQIKEEEAAAKAAAKAAEAAAKSASKSSSKSSSGSSSKSSSSSSSLSKAQVLNLMRQGVYDERFAAILGIPDESVRIYIKNAGSGTKSITTSTTDTGNNGRLPGTYKPAVK